MRLTVVGIGADGWSGLSLTAREALRRAETIVGSERQLSLLPRELPGARRPWPSPIKPLLEELIAAVEDAGSAAEARCASAEEAKAHSEPAQEARSGRHGQAEVCVLASGDPMLHGIGATLARRISGEHLTVVPHPSAFALACARLLWPQADVALVSAVGRPLAVVARVLQPGRRVVVFLSGEDGAARLSSLLCERGFGGSRFVVLEQLGSSSERVRESTATLWGERAADPLHLVAIECSPCSHAQMLPLIAGLPDEAYATDGQLTKWPVRAIALAALKPMPGQLLWDVGAGSGSVGIEWMRMEPSASAIAIEADAARAKRAAANAQALGVPGLEVRHGRAPSALVNLPSPAAIFLGGGVALPGMLQTCWQALSDGGRIVANAVTLEGEQALAAARARYGGELLQVAISDARPLGSFMAWKPRRPLVQWAARKERL